MLVITRATQLRHPEQPLNVGRTWGSQWASPDLSINREQTRPLSCDVFGVADVLSQFAHRFFSRSTTALFYPLRRLAALTSAIFA